MIQPLFLFKLAGLPFFSYTLLVTVGLAAAFLLALPGLRCAGLPVGDGVEATACMAMPALFCGRVAHVLYNMPYFSERPLQMWWFADGGLGLVGVALGGVFGLFVWCRMHGTKFMVMLDVAAAPIAVLATAAWMGALFQGSHYGAPADGPFSLELRDGFGVIVPRWPTQLLAASWCALTALTVMAEAKRVAPIGRQSAVFLLMYASGLFVLDLTRGDPSIYILGFRLTQWLYVVAITGGLFIIGRSYARA